MSHWPTDVNCVRDLMIAKSRIAKLEGVITSVLDAYRAKYSRPATEGIRNNAPLRGEMCALVDAMRGQS